MKNLQKFLKAQKKLICTFLEHKPAIKKGVEFADGTFGQPYIYCERCGCGEIEMVANGLLHQIEKIKLDYKFYMMNWDNMR